MREKILLVEDESAIVDTIIYALKTDGFEPLRCATAAEALSFLGREAAALIILDIGLPDTDGFSLAREIRKTLNTPIIFLTARNDEIDKVVGLELGADDYISKPFSPRELTARVKAVLRRTLASQQQSQPSIKSAPSTKSSVFIIDDQRYQISYHTQLLDLSPYEYKILKVLISSPGRVYTREHLMALCWEEPEMSLERTIDAHIKNMRQKLRAITPQEDPICTHRGLGYSLKEGL